MEVVRVNFIFIIILIYRTKDVMREAPLKVECFPDSPLENLQYTNGRGNDSTKCILCC